MAIDYIFEFRFYGNTEKAEKLMDEWKYVTAKNSSEKYVSYTIITEDELPEDFDPEDYETIVENIYMLYPGEKIDNTVDGFTYWNVDGGFWEGNDERWIYAMTGCSRSEADELHSTYLPENPSMFDEAIIMRFADEKAIVEYMKTEAFGKNGPLAYDQELAKHMPPYHLPGSPVSIAFAESVEPQFKALYDEDFVIYENITDIVGFDQEKNEFTAFSYPGGVMIASSGGGKGLFDSVSGMWILPAEFKEIIYTGGGYMLAESEEGHGLIRLMKDNRLQRIVSVFVAQCRYEKSYIEDGVYTLELDNEKFIFDKAADCIVKA